MRACPHCNEELDYLNYVCSTSGRQWGTINDNDDWDCEDNETNDTYDYDYSCPECNEIIETDGSPYEWLNLDEETAQQSNEASSNIWSNAQ